MRSLPLVVALTLSVAGVERGARAEDYEASGGTAKAYKHGGQFKLYAHIAEAYRLIFVYNDDDYCGEADKSFCRDVTPPFLEAGIGYGVTNSFELLTDVRIGLGDDFVPQADVTAGRKGPRVFGIQPGLRVFIDDTGSVKFFTTFQLSIDLTDYSKNAVSASTDIGIRNVNGLLIDFHRTLGFYVHLGDTFSFVRWFRFEIDGGIGLMVRLP